MARGQPYIEKRPNGRYYFDFWYKGNRFRGPEGGASTKAAAIAAHKAAKEGAIADSVTRRAPRSSAMRLSDACNRFWNEVGTFYSRGKANGTYRKTVYNALGWLTDAIGANTLIRDINAATVVDAIARRRGEKVKNATVNRTVTELLRRILRRAAKIWNQEVQELEWHKFMLPEPKERVRELRDHEEDTIALNMRNDYWPAINFLKLSGARKEELVGEQSDDLGGLQWNDIDFKRKLCTLRGKSTGEEKKERVIPLTDEMIAILSIMRGHHKTKVFTFVAQRTRSNAKTKRLYRRGQRYPMTYSGLSTAWRRFGGCKLEDFRMHDLRHTAATRLLRSSGNLKAVGVLLGHSDVATTAKYAHVNVEDLRLLMENLSKSEAKKVPTKVPTRSA